MNFLKGGLQTGKGVSDLIGLTAQSTGDVLRATQGDPEAISRNIGRVRGGFEGFKDQFIKQPALGIAEALKFAQDAKPGEFAAKAAELPARALLQFPFETMVTVGPGKFLGGPVARGAERAGQAAQAVKAPAVVQRGIKAVEEVGRAVEAVGPVKAISRATEKQLRKFPFIDQGFKNRDAFVRTGEIVLENKVVDRTRAIDAAASEVGQAFKGLSKVERETFLDYIGGLRAVPDEAGPQLQRALQFWGEMSPQTQQFWIDKGLLKASSAKVRRSQVARAAADPKRERALQEQRKAGTKRERGEAERELSRWAEEVEATVMAQGKQAPLYFPLIRKVKASDVIGSALKRSKPSSLRQSTGILAEEAATGGKNIVRDPRVLALKMRREAIVFEATDKLVNRIVTDPKLGARVFKPGERLGPNEKLFAPDGFMRVYRKNIDFSDEVAKTIEATGDVEGALSKALQKSIIEGAFEAEARDLARQRVFVINRRVAERLRDEFPEPTAFSRGLRVFYDTPLAYWKAAVLPLRPAWIGNNVVGSTMFGLLEGVGPRDYRNALSKQYRMAVNEHAPMVGIGGLTAAEGRGLLRQQAGPAGSATEQVVQGLESLPPVRAFQALADRGRLVNEHVESFYRTAGFSKEIRSAVRKSYLKRTGDASLKALDELEELSNIPRADVDKAIKAVNFFHNNYFAGNPLERQVIRRIIPFESFMKHQARLLFQLPVEYPGRAFAFNATARIAEEAMAAQSDNLPEFMQDSGTQDLGFTVPIDGRKFRVLLNTQGVNPFMMGFSTTGGPGLDTGNIARSLVQQSAPPFQFGVSAATGQDQFGRPFSEMGVTGRRGRFFARPGQFPEERVKNRLGAVDEVGRPLPSPGEFAAGAVPQLGLARRLINPRSGFTADPFSTESKADESSPFMRTRLLELMRYLTPISITLLDVTEPGGRRPLSRRETISILRSLQRQENISEQGNEKSPE